MQPGVICAAAQSGANQKEMSSLGQYLAWDSLQELTGKSRYQLEQSGVSLSKLESGKPVWKGIEAGVSISHTGNVAVAASAFFEIGVDLELADRENLRVASRMFSKNEQEWLNQQRLEGKADAFSCLWTLREGYAKWTGLGLAGIGNLDISQEILAQGKTRPLEFRIEEDGVFCSDPRCQAELMELEVQGKRYRMAMVYDNQEKEILWKIKISRENQ